MGRCEGPSVDLVPECALRDEVEKTRQSAYEPEASFSRRFREVADAAYRGECRNEDQNRILIRAFARGLRSDELARKLVEEGNPTTLKDAFTTLAGYSARKDAYARLSRHEEPMEVAPVNPASPRPVVGREDQTTATLLKKLLQSQERLQTKVAKLEAQARPPRTTAAPATPPAFRERGPEQPLCTVQEPGLVGPLPEPSLLPVRPRGPHAPRVPPKPCGKRTEVVGAVSGRPVVDLQVGGLSIGALVETGASCTLLLLNIFHTLADRAHRHRLLADAPALRGVSGASLDVRGSTEIKIQGVAKTIRVTVLGDLPCKMVLGEDALQDGQGIIDFGRNALRWHRREWPMRRIQHALEASPGQVLPETGDGQINQLIQKNAYLFSAKGEPNGFCSNSPIHNKTNNPPISQAAYRTPLSKRKLVEEAIADMFSENVFRPS